jgi:hypothetical protein
MDVQVRQAEDTALVLTNLGAKQPSLNISSVPLTPPALHPDTLNSDTLVLNPTFITQEFDLLRFGAAAFDQLPKSTEDIPASSSHHPTTILDTTSTSPLSLARLFSSPKL